MMMKHALNSELTRLMRRTGKLYTLTLVSSAMTILASVLAIFWNENSSAFHLWVDLIPHGFGMASFITSTLIVRVIGSLSVCFIWQCLIQAMIAGVYKEDMAVATGSTWSCWKQSMNFNQMYDPSYLSFQNDGSSLGRQFERCNPTSCASAKTTRKNIRARRSAGKCLCNRAEVKTRRVQLSRSYMPYSKIFSFQLFV